MSTLPRRRLDVLVALGCAAWLAILIVGMTGQSPDSDSAQHLASARGVAERREFTGVFPELLLPDGRETSVHYPGLYYVVAGAAWAAGGPLAVRLLGPVAVVSAGILAYVLMRRLGHPTAGVVAVGLLLASEDVYLIATQPFLEPLLLFLTAASLLALAAALADPTRAKGLVLGLAVGALVATKQQGWFVAAGIVAALVTAIIARRDRRALAKASLFALASAVVVSAPFLAIYWTVHVQDPWDPDDVFANVLRDRDPGVALDFVLATMPVWVWLAVVAAGLAAWAAFIAWTRHDGVRAPLALAMATGAAFLAPAFLAGVHSGTRYWTPAWLLVAMLVPLGVASAWRARRRMRPWGPQASIAVALVVLSSSVAMALPYPGAHAADEDRFPGVPGRFASVLSAAAWADANLPKEARILAPRMNEVVLYTGRATAAGVENGTTPQALATSLEKLGIRYVWVDATRVGAGKHDETPIDWVRHLYLPGVARLLHRNSHIDLLEVDWASLRSAPDDTVVFSLDDRATQRSWPVRVDPPSRWMRDVDGWVPATNETAYLHVLTPPDGPHELAAGLTYLDGVGAFAVAVRRGNNSYTTVARLDGGGTGDLTTAWFPLGSDLHFHPVGGARSVELLLYGSGSLKFRQAVTTRATGLAEAATTHAWIDATGNAGRLVSGDVLSRGRPAAAAEAMRAQLSPADRVLSPEPLAAAFLFGTERWDLPHRAALALLAEPRPAAAGAALLDHGVTHVLVDYRALDRQGEAPSVGLVGALGLPGAAEVRALVDGRVLARVDAGRLADFPLKDDVLIGGETSSMLGIPVEPPDRLDQVDGIPRVPANVTGYTEFVLPRADSAAGVFFALVDEPSLGSAAPRGRSSSPLSPGLAYFAFDNASAYPWREWSRLTVSVNGGTAGVGIRAAYLLAGPPDPTAAAAVAQWLAPGAPLAPAPPSWSTSDSLSSGMARRLATLTPDDAHVAMRDPVMIHWVAGRAASSPEKMLNATDAAGFAAAAQEAGATHLWIDDRDLGRAFSQHGAPALLGAPGLGELVADDGIVRVYALRNVPGLRGLLAATSPGSDVSPRWTTRIEPPDRIDRTTGALTPGSAVYLSLAAPTHGNETDRPLTLVIVHEGARIRLLADPADAIPVASLAPAARLEATFIELPARLPARDGSLRIVLLAEGAAHVKSALLFDGPVPAAERRSTQAWLAAALREPVEVGRADADRAACTYAAARAADAALARVGTTDPGFADLTDRARDAPGTLGAASIESLLAASAAEGVDHVFWAVEAPPAVARLVGVGALRPVSGGPGCGLLAIPAEADFPLRGEPLASLDLASPVALDPRAGAFAEPFDRWAAAADGLEATGETAYLRLPPLAGARLVAVRLASGQGALHARLGETFTPLGTVTAGDVAWFQVAGSGPIELAWSGRGAVLTHVVAFERDLSDGERSAVAGWMER